MSRNAHRVIAVFYGIFSRAAGRRKGGKQQRTEYIKIFFHIYTTALLLRRACSIFTGDSAEYDDVGNRAGSDAVIAMNAAGYFARRI